MYKIAKLNIKSALNDKDEQIGSVANLLGMLYKNGQILQDYLVEDHQMHYIATVTTTDDDSLESKYFNQYIQKELEQLEMSYEIIADDALASYSCHCKEHSYYVLAIDPNEYSSPITCGDCGKEIPLIHVPYIEQQEEHFSILGYQRMYQSVDDLWMSSLSDRFTKRQIIDPNSQLNKRGLDICAELEKQVNKPVYLLLGNPIGGLFEFEKNNKKLEACPKCDGSFRYVNDNDFIDKVCDNCRLALIGPKEKF